MTENEDKVNQLLVKLETLLKRQDNFSKEINELSGEIHRLKYSTIKEQLGNKEEKGSRQFVLKEVVESEIAPVPPVRQTYQLEMPPERPRYFAPQRDKDRGAKSDLEKFVGENLINKIGIIITVIGVAIGAKYSIEHELISPLTRIILGYLVGLGLLGFGIKLKTSYENYSAVLVSGAMAIMYFMTYAAFGFYHLMPQVLAFSLMVVFTALSVVAAMNYNKQVIAHIGLVGAYAVPFLLSDNSGKVVLLFTYMAIINSGILVIAVKKYWKPVYYSSFLLTWLIFLSWFTSKYQANEHFGIALTFVCIFFATFYVIFLAYKLLQKEKYDMDDSLLLLANSFLFYGVGYAILKDHEPGEQLLGLFTLGNAIIHFGVSLVIYRQKLADRNLFYLVAGLVLAFITIAVPVQLDGNWVTLLWACESALLFWLGRTKSVFFYEKLSYILMILAFFSLIHDWSSVYRIYNPEQPETRITPLFNINFLTSALFIVCFGFIHLLSRHPKFPSPLISTQGLLKVVPFIFPSILLFVLYFSFRMEISAYWHQLYLDSKIVIPNGELVFRNRFQDTDLMKFKTIWVLNYSLLFMSLLSFFNVKKLRDSRFGLICLGLSSFVLLIFLVQGLFYLGILRESYLRQTMSEYYLRGGFHIGIRYISLAFAGLLLFSISKTIQQDFIKSVRLNLKVAFDILLYTSLLWMASSELIAWMDITRFTQSYKLGLSILWGVGALIFIALGIWKKKKHLRIGAIALFGVTLVKLFFYDISHLDTIAKTIVFVSLGILLLIISFLYNKYKHIISDEN